MADQPALPPQLVGRHLDIKPKASTWARTKLEQERQEKVPTDDSGVRQLTVRMPAEQVAFVDAIAERFKVSRNAAVSILLGSACGDVYEELPIEERKALLATVSKLLGHQVRPYWERERPKAEDSDGPSWDESNDLEHRSQV